MTNEATSWGFLVRFRRRSWPRDLKSHLPAGFAFRKSEVVSADAFAFASRHVRLIAILLHLDRCPNTGSLGSNPKTPAPERFPH